MYVDYDYYRDTYGGTDLTESTFPAAVRKAEAHIRYLTFANGDIFADAAHAEAVKAAVCAAAEACHAAELEMEEGGNLKSESKDGLSVSYVVSRRDGETVVEYARRRMYQALREYLLPTGWLSRKVRCGNDRKCGCHDYI